jgi:FdhD protein
MGVTTSRRGITRVVGGSASTTTDAVAVEAPLTIILDGEVLVTTMRTPGHDLDLVAGWLVNESGVTQRDDIAGMGAFAAHDDDGVDAVRFTLAAGVTPPRPRSFVTSSACGVCSADVLAAFTGPDAPLHSDGWGLPANAIPALIDGMRDGQRMFDQTGALHAAALVGPALEPLWVREDVGRHNAVDKVIGRALFEDRVPLTDHTLVVSGRISYEIVHKALTACVGAVVAVSGPTSLAIDLARAHGLVLAGFARGDRVNVYSGDDRVTTGGPT